jgi:ferritin-like metal-binding protein YciE
MNTKSGKNDTVTTVEKHTETAGKKNDDAQTPMLEKFFCDMLKDMYWAEQHLIKALPGMKDAATTEALQDAFEDHLYETHKHISRLEKVFGVIGKTPETKKCEAMEGLVRECENLVKETKDGTMTRDVALVIGAQKIEHYEIASYGSLVQLALTMGLHKAADILDDTLMEEEQSDHMLTEIAEGFINIEADEEGSYSWATAHQKINQEAVEA